MAPRLRIAYIVHSIRSDWNNGNAHFLRGLLRALTESGHEVTTFEPEAEWSINNLRMEECGPRALENFEQTYPDLKVVTFKDVNAMDRWRERLTGFDIVTLHEWNPPTLAQMLLRLRDQGSFKLLFHDTHHRASSSPEDIERFGLKRFDGVLAFGEALRVLYRERFGIERVWTLHEAADVSVFYPREGMKKQRDVVWVGNWGEGERAQEICEFLLTPATKLAGNAGFSVYGVRYPESGLKSLRESRVEYGGYLPNLEAPGVYARSRVTVHIPRQQYSSAMTGIPTIRVFEALASGIPLISAPWSDTEQLFRPGDFCFAQSGEEMTRALEALLRDPDYAQRQAERGLETVRSRHTCAHRALEFTKICEEIAG